MKDSGVEWIGEIPDEWTVIPLKYTAKCNNQVLSEQTDGDTQIFYIDIGSVSSDGNILEVQTLSFEEAPSRARRVVYENDTIISTVRTYLKAIAFISKSYNNFIVSTGFAVLTPQKQYDSRYFYYALRVDWFISLIESNSVGISYPAINSEKLISLPNIVPPLQTQNRIASFLDTKCSLIDSTIEKEREIIEKLKEYRQAVITEAVTKGIRAGVPMKDSGVEWIGEIPEGWNFSRVKYEFIILDDKRQPISSEFRGDIEGFYDYYGASGIIDKINDYLFDETLLLIGEDGANLVMRNLPLIYIAKGKYWVNNHAHVLKPKETNNLYYMAYQLESVDLFSFITGSTQPKLTQYKLSIIPVIVPPLSEQQEIADFLDKKCSGIDTTIQKRELAIEKLTAYKQSLIYECVTGKREVLA